MRFTAFILSLLLATILLCESIAVTSAEDVQQEKRQKYDAISFAGRTEFEIPTQLWCRDNSRLLQNN